MDGMLQSERGKSFALALGKLLEEHRGDDVVVMDMRNLNFWTDFFIITTVTSNTHLLGLERHIKEFTRENGIDILRRSRKPASNRVSFSYGSASEESGSSLQGTTAGSSDEWCLIDLGDIVIHLMSVRTRSFFELERLWSDASFIYRTGS